MSGYAEAGPAGGRGPLPDEFDGWRWSHRSFGPPLPVKILAVVAAFWLFHPLGVALLVYFLWRAARHGGRARPRPGIRPRLGRNALGPPLGASRVPQRRVRRAPTRHAETARRGGRGVRRFRAQATRGGRPRSLRAVQGGAEHAAGGPRVRTEWRKPKRPRRRRPGGGVVHAGFAGARQNRSWGSRNCGMAAIRKIPRVQTIWGRMRFYPIASCSSMSRPRSVRGSIHAAALPSFSAGQG